MFKAGWPCAALDFAVQAFEPAMCRKSAHPYWTSTPIHCTLPLERTRDCARVFDWVQNQRMCMKREQKNRKIPFRVCSETIRILKLSQLAEIAGGTNTSDLCWSTAPEFCDIK